jgi:hypothetical protein
MLEQLKRLDLDRNQLDDLLAFAAFAKSLHAEYDQRSIAAPEWLDEKIRQLNREITSRGLDALEMRLKEIRAQQTQLLTPSEKREKLAAEEAALTAKLTGAIG